MPITKKIRKKNLKKQIGGLNSYKKKCIDIKRHHDIIRRKGTIKQEDLDKAKAENTIPPKINNESVIEVPFNLVFDKKYKDPVNETTAPTKGLVTDMNSFAMYASHHLFMSYFDKMKTCPLLRTQLKGQEFLKMVKTYDDKRDVYLAELAGFTGDNTEQYNFGSGLNGLGNLIDFREIVMRTYRIINNKINVYCQDRSDDKKCYFVFKGGLSLKYMLESLISDMQCNLPKKNGANPLHGNTQIIKRQCNEDRQKIFNKINIPYPEDTNFQFHELSKTYIGQDSENPYFKASDFDTGIYIPPDDKTFDTDYKKISKIVLNVLIDQKDFFDSIWLYNAEKSQDLFENNIQITQYWNDLKNIKHLGPYRYNDRNIFDTRIEMTPSGNLESQQSVEAKNKYYKMCTDLFFDRIRIITYLLELVPELYDINNGMKRRQHVKKNHVKFIELFKFHEIYKITKQQLFNDKNIDFHTGKIDKNKTKLISPVSKIPGDNKYPEHPLQNILYTEYKLRNGDKIRGTPKSRRTSKIIFNTSEFLEQCYQENPNTKKNTFSDSVREHKTPYYISNNDSINLTRISETNKKNLIKRFGSNTVYWPTGNTSFGLIRSKLNYKVLMNYSYKKNNIKITKDYKKDAPGEMIDISIPLTRDLDLGFFFGIVSHTNRLDNSRVKFIDLTNYSKLDEGTVKRVKDKHGVLRYEISWDKGRRGIYDTNDKNIFGVDEDATSRTAKYKYITTINGVNTLNLNYIIKDTIQMLAFHNLCPWTDSKYEKRLYRALVVVLFQYIIKNAVDRTLPQFSTWKKYSRKKFTAVYSKLDLENIRTCSGLLYKEEDGIINKLEEEVINKWKKIYKRKKKIAEKKAGHDDWIDITRTYNLKIYIRNLLKKIGNENDVYNPIPNGDTTENEFNELVYKITTLWATQVLRFWGKDAKEERPEKLDIEIIKNYMFFAFDNTNKIRQIGIAGNPKKDFISRNEIMKIIRKSKDEIDGIQNENTRNYENEVRLRYSKIREYFSKYKSYEKTCDLEKAYETQSNNFKRRIDDICIELYNKYIKNPGIGNLIANMDIVSAKSIQSKYFSTNKNPQEEIKTYRGGKKIRKHKGIHQIGANKGRLKKGYKYSGKKLKSGLSEIISVKRKRSMTNRKI